MKLIYYEFCKILTRRTFYLAIICFSFVIIGYGLFADTNTYSKDYQSYIYVSDNQVKTQVQVIQKKIELEEQIRAYRQAVITDNQSKLMTFPVHVVEAYQERLQSGKDLPSTLKELKEAKQYLVNIMSYEQFQTSIDKSSLPRIKKDNYAKIKPESVVSTNYIAFESFFSQKILGVILFVLILVLNYLIFDYEIDRKMDIHLYMAKQRTKVYVAKLIVSLLLLSILAILFSMLLYLIYAFQYGFSSIFINIQSIPLLYTAPINVSVVSFMLLYILFQIMVSSIILCIVFVVRSISKQTKIAMLSVFIFYFIAFGLHLFVKPEDYASILYYLNIFTWIHPSYIFNNSYLVSFNGIELYTYQLVVLVFVISLVALLGFVIYQSKSRVREQSTIQFPIFLKGKHASTLRHEWYKTLIMNKGLLILIVFIGMIGYLRNGERQAIASYGSTSVNPVYEQYTGVLTSDKQAEIDAKKVKIDTRIEVFKQISKGYFDGLIDEETYQSKQKEYTDHYEEDYLFFKFYKHYENRLSDVIVFPDGYRALLRINKNNDYTEALLYSLMLLFSLAGLYIIDHKNQEDALYVLCAKGRYIRYRDKVIIALTFALLVYVLSVVTRSILYINMFHLDEWNLPITAILEKDDVVSLPIFVQNNFTIGMYFIITNLIQLLSLSVFALIVLLLSRMMKNRLLILVTGISVIFIPFILLLNSLSIGDWFSFINIINGQALLSDLGVVKSIANIILFIVLLRYLLKDKYKYKLI